MNFLSKTIALIPLLASIAIPVYAQDSAVTPTPSTHRWFPTRKEVRVFALKHEKVIFGSAKVTAVNGTTITVDKGGTSYTVLTGTFAECTTKFVRHYSGASSLSEVAVGNTLNVIGFWQDDAKTTVNACLVRNQSIAKRCGSFVGTVQSVSSNGFVMTTARDPRSNQTVTVSSSTTFMNRNGGTIAQPDIVVGNKVLVKGVWDRPNSTVSEVMSVKDFSLPR